MKDEPSVTNAASLDLPHVEVSAANQWLADLLVQHLGATVVLIEDNSWQHAGHAAMKGVTQTEGTHLTMVVVSPQFEGVGLMDRYRQVHQVLKPAMDQGLHALQLKVHTPLEWLQKQA